MFINLRGHQSSQRVLKLSQHYRGRIVSRKTNKYPCKLSLSRFRGYSQNTQAKTLVCLAKVLVRVLEVDVRSR